MCIRDSYKRWHLIGLELPYSVASVGIRGEATGAATEFRADVVAVAKRDLSAGELLDGEGGYTVSGGLRPAMLSVRNDTYRLDLHIRLSSSAQSSKIRR